MRLVADIETNGLLRQKNPIIHCLVTQDMDTDEIIRYDDTGKYPPIKQGLTNLMVADEIWGHNWIGFDQSFIREIYPFYEPTGKTYDTLILSRLFFTDLLSRDFAVGNKSQLPIYLYGRHSLMAWGYRNKCYKSEFGKSLDNDWSTYSPEMLEYCVQDVLVSRTLVEKFYPQLDQYTDCIDTEHKIAEIMSWQESCGWPFDTKAAHQLERKLRKELDSISEEMRQQHPYMNGGLFTPKRDNKTRGYVAGAEMCRLKEFNPASRDHIEFVFDWFEGHKLQEKTDKGKIKVDDKILREIGTPKALKFARILELQKHLGQLSEGKNAWLKLETNGRLHHSCILNTNTGRMAHLRPNAGQVPSAPEYRSLFGPGAGRVQVAADASGLELRVLGALLFPFDQGKFAKEVVDGDIHTKLANIYNTSRSTGKSCTYCMIYGGGDVKLGLTAGASKEDAASKGKDIKQRIMGDLDGFQSLSSAITKEAKTGTLKGLDGRPIRIQGKNHASLNYKIQSYGAVICKLWCIRVNELLKEAEIDYYPLGFIHDEIQLSVHPDHAEQAAFCLVAAMKDVEQQIHFKCQLDAESVIGNNWAECH